MTELTTAELWQSAPIEAELLNVRDFAGRVEVPSYTTDRTDAREGITAKTVMEAANLLDAVRAANAPRLTVRLALVAGLLSHLDLMEPGETTEC